jgi:cysteine desulfurase
MIYLDYSANTPADNKVLQQFVKTEQQFFGNPNSNHCAGQLASSAMVDATKSIATLLGIDAEEIILTSGASEANNLAIKGIARACRHTGRHIISTPLEHPSVSGPLTYLQEQGWEIDLVKIGTDGKIDLEDFASLIRNDTVLVAICAVDSELGTIQPINEIAEILKDYPNCHLHVDYTQAIGKVKVDINIADTGSFAPHKFYGLVGSGALFKKKDLVIEPLIHGGASTTLYRSGTPTLALAVAMDKALDLATNNFDERVEIVRERNAELRKALAKYPKVRINSPEGAVPHILNISVQGVKGIDFQKALSDNGVCVSVKSACSVENTPSRAVFAVSRDRKNALSSWRISLSHLTSEDEINEFLKIFDSCYKELTQ